MSYQINQGGQYQQYNPNNQPIQSQILVNQNINNAPINSTLSKHPSQNLQYSRIQQHNIYKNTDRLYDPLRGVLIHPQQVVQHSRIIPETVRHSYLTHDYKILTPYETQQLKRNTYIPKDVYLSQTDHFDKVKNKDFVAVNAQQRIIGKPISALQMEKLKTQGVKKSMVVYDFNEPEYQEVVKQVEPTTKYRSPPIENYQKHNKQYKYNLYSMIDQPMNRCRQFGCKGMSCPGNQIIASKNQPQSLSWLR